MTRFATIGRNCPFLRSVSISTSNPGGPGMGGKNRYETTRRTAILCRPFSTSNPAAGCFSRGNISLGVHASTLSGKEETSTEEALAKVVRLPSGV